MVGSKYCPADRRCYYNLVENCEIYGSVERIGGLHGKSTSYEENAVVRNCKIVGESPNTKYVGGLIGWQEYLVWYCTVDNSQILSKGDVVGGISGHVECNSSHGPINCYAKDSVVEGNNKVGGILGEIRDGPIRFNSTNAKVTAITSKAGGIAGYFENTDMTAATRTITMEGNSVNGATITSPTEVGGLVGNIAKDLYTEKDFFYNNYVHAYLTSGDTANVSMGIGGSKTNNPIIKNTWIYKYSTINGEYMNEDIDTYTENQYVIAKDLKSETTYKDKFKFDNNFNYTYLSQNKYPLPSNIENQEGIDLPEDPVSTLEAQAMTLENSENLKNAIALSGTNEKESKIGYDVYAISANEINIDLNNVSDGATLKIGETEIPVKSRTYTFKYDFNTIQTLVLTDNDQKVDIIITPDNIKNYVSLVGDTYSYLVGSKLNVCGTEIEGDFVNLYGSQALTTEGRVYDIERKGIDQSINKVESLILEETVKPKEEYEYQGNKIQVFGKYSIIGDKVRQQIYTARREKLSILSSKLDFKIGQKVVEIANEKEYETILKTSGTLVDLKTKLNYPEKFANTGIKAIAQNTDTEKTEMIVFYEDGQAIVFNYLTGEEIFKGQGENNTSNKDISLLDYIKAQINNLKENITSSDISIINNKKEYGEAQDLAQILEEIPVEVARQKVNTNSKTESETNNNINNQITSQDYITSYNPETNKYEVYSQNEIVESSKEEPVSETQKIIEGKLEDYYSEQKAIAKDDNELSGVTIIICVVLGIGICILLGYKFSRRYTK